MHLRSASVTNGPFVTESVRVTYFSFLSSSVRLLYDFRSSGGMACRWSLPIETVLFLFNVFSFEGSCWCNQRTALTISFLSCRPIMAPTLQGNYIWMFFILCCIQLFVFSLKTDCTLLILSFFLKSLK